MLEAGNDVKSGAGKRGDGRIVEDAAACRSIDAVSLKEANILFRG